MTGYTWVSNSGVVLFYVVIGLLVFVLPHFQSQSGQTLTTATLIILYLVSPITETMALLPLLRQAAVALSRILQLGDVLNVRREHDTTTPDPFFGHAPPYLELKGVRHKYSRDDQDGDFMLGPMDLSVAQGELLFITGGNGSGKTTLAMLILGLYEPQAGEIVFRGTAVNQANIAHYRRKFSAVFSDFHLFEHLLGDDQEGLQTRATHYIKAFGMAQKVTVENGKFSALKLSTGQRKRLALISSYLDDRPIYLFDEWAADQDPAFKAVFYTELLPELKRHGKTVIVITHDDHYFGSADRIIKLTDGRLLPTC
jgi:putative ATP-binding cassette transporter